MQRTIRFGHGLDGADPVPFARIASVGTIGLFAVDDNGAAATNRARIQHASRSTAAARNR